jgi:hypothetical protein
MNPRQWTVQPNPGGWFNLYRGDQFIGRVRAHGDATRIAATLNSAELAGSRDAIHAAVRRSHTDTLIAATHGDNEWDVADVMAALAPFLRDDTP